jgi:predicted Zn-ribbon and HTH transcriptional regulator
MKEQTTPQKCNLCGYKWNSRKKTPKQCPNCKRMDWNKK